MTRFLCDEPVELTGYAPRRAGGVDRVLACGRPVGHGGAHYATVEVVAGVDAAAVTVYLSWETD